MEVSVIDWGDVLAVLGVLLLAVAAWWIGAWTGLVAFTGSLLLTVAVVRMITMRRRA